MGLLLKWNFCFDVNGRFATTWMVTLWVFQVSSNPQDKSAEWNLIEKIDDRVCLLTRLQTCIYRVPKQVPKLSIQGWYGCYIKTWSVTLYLKCQRKGGTQRTQLQHRTSLVPGVCLGINPEMEIIWCMQNCESYHANIIPQTSICMWRWMWMKIMDTY